MIRIEKSENGDLVTFVLSGRMQEEDLQELKTFLKKHNKQNVVLDLKGVKLVDRDALLTHPPVDDVAVLTENVFMTTKRLTIKDRAARHVGDELERDAVTSL